MEGGATWLPLQAARGFEGRQCLALSRRGQSSPSARYTQPEGGQAAITSSRQTTAATAAASSTSAVAIQAASTGREPGSLAGASASRGRGGSIGLCARGPRAGMGRGAGASAGGPGCGAAPGASKRDRPMSGSGSGGAGRGAEGDGCGAGAASAGGGGAADSGGLAIHSCWHRAQRRLRGPAARSRSGTSYSAAQLGQVIRIGTDTLRARARRCNSMQGCAR